MIFFKKIWTFRQLRCRRALARQSSAILVCGLLATIPNALLSCSKKIIAASSSSTPTATQTQSPVEKASPAKTANTSSKPDFDLTKMSATMIYSTIFDMLIMPEDYVEKVIKVKGWFETYTNPETGELFYAVVVPDATACCQQGLEFIWPGDHHYPADFPNPGQDVTVTGRYKLVDKDGFTYNYLEASNVEF